MDAHEYGYDDRRYHELNLRNREAKTCKTSNGQTQHLKAGSFWDYVTENVDHVRESESSSLKTVVW